MKKNAIILTRVGKDLDEQPQLIPSELRLFDGEVKIERLIRQMNEAGIKDIFIVIGNNKSRFFYLEEKYGIKVIDNQCIWINDIYSLSLVREYLNDSFVCYGDAFFDENPFIYEYGFCKWVCSDNLLNVISEFYSSTSGNKENRNYTTCYYMRKEDSDAIKSIIESSVNNIELDTKKNVFSRTFEDIIEAEYKKFEVINHKIEFDTTKMLNYTRVDNVFNYSLADRMIAQICSVVKCEKEDIKGVQILKGGNTNISFLFTVNACGYVYRNPGNSADVFVNRKNEIIAQNAIKEYGIDPTLMYIDETGVKISTYMKNCVPFDYGNIMQLETLMEKLRNIHNLHVIGVKEFDIMNSAHNLLELADRNKGALLREFSSLEKKVSDLYELTLRDNYAKVLAHCDVHAGNFLCFQDDIFVIDWEFSGMCDFAYDLGCMISYEWFTDDEINNMFEAYFGRKLTFEEERHCKAYIAISGWYYMCWSMYKESIGELVKFNMYNRFRNVQRFLNLSIEAYRRK